MNTYKIEVSSDESANPNSSRAGLWEAAPGEATGWTDKNRAVAAANACLEIEGIGSARVGDELSGEVVFSV